MRSLFAAVLTAALAGVAPASVIVNGSFENGTNPGSGFLTLGAGDNTSITGWTVGSGSVDYIGGYWQASSGGRSIDLSGNGAGSLSQTFATVAGQNYRVTFDLAGNPDSAGVKTLTVSAAANSQVFNFDSTGKSRPAMGWTGQTFFFTATGSSTTLTFTSNTNSAFGPALDNVVVDPVPEPLSLVVFGGLVVGGAGIALRRRMTAKA